MLCHVSFAPDSLLRDGWLVSLCVARMFMMLIGMSYAATLPLLLTTWDMSATATGSISTSVQLAYAVSLMLFSWLADRIGARRVLMTSVSRARSYVSGLVLYTL